AATILVIVFFIGGVQAKFEEKRLINDVRATARAVAESMGSAIEIIMTENKINKANGIVADFEKMKRTQGCIIYGKQGQVIATSDRFKDTGEIDGAATKTIMEQGKPGYIQGSVD